MQPGTSANTKYLLNPKPARIQRPVHYPRLANHVFRESIFYRSFCSGRAPCGDIAFALRVTIADGMCLQIQRKTGGR